MSILIIVLNIIIHNIIVIPIPMVRKWGGRATRNNFSKTPNSFEKIEILE